MSADSDRIDKLVASVSEGSPVDWPKVEAKDTGEEDLSCLAALEKLAHIAEFNRRLQRMGGARELQSLHRSCLSPWIPAAETPPALFRWGHLEALELVGRGSFGEVYRAIDTRLQREVALKLRRDESAATGTSNHRFLNEARDLARVRHPNVIVVHGADFHADQIGFWTDFIHGQTLTAHLAARGPLGEREVILVGLDLCRALGAVHAAGLLHGDVKASNAMIEENGRVVLMDFGAARSWGEKPVRSVRGSPLIMAPEILDGHAPSPAADLYSLGVLLFQLASGQLPFVAESIPELRRQLEDGPQPMLGELCPDLPAALVAVIERSLSREANRRYQSAAEMESALHATLASPQAKRHALPAEADLLIGRETDLDALEGKLADGSRLVTLLGAAGMGKTRLAVRYGWQGLDTWPGGVWFCDLSEATSLGRIVSVVSESLGVPLGKEDPVEHLGRAIAAHQRCLVILDNFEQLVDLAEATVGRWLEQAPEARFLVTSRERLGVRGESVQIVEPLPVETGTALFLDRARRQHPSGELEGAASDAVRELVTLADGIPLAIELAAARVTVMTPAQIAARMRDRFRILSGGTAPAGRGARHATLEAAIDGSWELLAPWEKAAFTQCSVFQGGFTLEAAENVLDLSPWPDAPWVVDVVQSLVDKSLLRALRGEGSPVGATPMRLGMFVSLQEYARAKLQASDVAGSEPAALATEERHRRWYARFGSDEVMEALNIRGGIDLGILVADLDNLMAACRSAAAHKDGRSAAATYRAIEAVYQARGPLKAAVDLGEELLRVEMDPAEQAMVREMLGRSLGSYGKIKEAGEHFAKALAIQRELGNRRREACLLGHLGFENVTMGRLDEARDQLAVALAIYQEDGDKRGEAAELTRLGTLHHVQGRYSESCACDEAALAICCTLGNRMLERAIRCNLAVAYARLGRTAEARAQCEAAIAIAREDGDRRIEGNVLDCMASIGLISGDQSLEEVREYAEAALAIHREMGNRQRQGTVFCNLAIACYRQGRMEEARGHFTTALAILREVNDVRSVSITLTNLAILDQDQGRLSEARAQHEEALGLNRSMGNRVGEGEVLSNLGILDFVAGLLMQSRARLEAALAIHRETENRPLQAKTLIALGHVDLEETDASRARAHAEEALAIAEDCKDWKLAGLAVGLSGRLQLAQGDLPGARESLDQAEAMLRPVALGVEIGDLLCARAQLEHQSGQPLAARKAIDEAAAIAVRIGSGPGSPLGVKLATTARMVIEAARSQ
jgi:predicted ATPase/tRNA A-37 threonylcarbamoyl transferase component Bud32/Tfp pilus assembly protein PilF